MRKKYTVAETTIIEREKIANDALAISLLDAQEPSDDTKKLVDEYIKGNKEISHILAETISKYQVERS